jgi:hypothetical protein
MNQNAPDNERTPTDANLEAKLDRLLAVSYDSHIVHYWISGEHWEHLEVFTKSELRFLLDAAKAYYAPPADASERLKSAEKAIDHIIHAHNVSVTALELAISYRTEYPKYMNDTQITEPDELADAKQTTNDEIKIEAALPLPEPDPQAAAPTVDHHRRKGDENEESN